MGDVKEFEEISKDTVRTFRAEELFFKAAPNVVGDALSIVEVGDFINVVDVSKDAFRMLFINVVLSESDSIVDEVDKPSKDGTVEGDVETAKRSVTPGRRGQISLEVGT